MLFFALIIMGLSWLAQYRLKSKFEKYSQTPLQANLSGREVAELMLSDANIRDVKVFSVEGKLTDHYNPTDKTVNLSPEVYNGRNAAAAAIAAHEVGHAVQHANAYSMLMFRSSMVPVLSAVSRFIPWLMIIGVLALNFSMIPLGLGIVLFAITTLFAFVTLPVEFDASRRALAFVQRRGVVNAAEYTMAKDALWWAASTYVIAAIGSLVTLLYYVMMFMGGRRS